MCPHPVPHAPSCGVCMNTQRSACNFSPHRANKDTLGAKASTFHFHSSVDQDKQVQLSIITSRGAVANMPSVIFNQDKPGHCAEPLRAAYTMNRAMTLLCAGLKLMIMVIKRGAGERMLSSFRHAALLIRAIMFMKEKTAFSQRRSRNIYMYVKNP